MTVMPAAFCEIAFTRDSAGWPLWQDVSDYVEWEKSVTISRRRSHELDEVQPGTLSLSLINTDGRFTAGRTSSPYYPNVTLNRPIRIRARWQGSVNLLLKGQAEGSNAALFSATTGTLATSATAPAGQTSSIRWSGTWASGDMIRIGAKAITTATDEAYNVVTGVTYSARCQARRETNTASMAVRIRWYDVSGVFLSENTGTGVALTTTFQAVSVSAAAPASAVFARVVFVATATGTSAAVLSSAWQFERAASPTTWVAPGSEYRRFTGFIDRWPHAWTNGVLGAVAITATDRQKLLSRDKIRQALAEETLATAPLAYYPLGEPENATQAGNLSITPQPDMVVQVSGLGGNLAFGAEGGPDESTGVLLSPGDTNGGLLLAVPMLTTPLGGGAGISVAAWVNFGIGSPLTGQNRILFVDNGADTIHFRINYALASNSLSVGARLTVGSAAGSTTSINLDDGGLHLVVAVAEFVTGTLRVRAYVDGALAFDTNTGLAGSTWPTLTRIRAGGIPGTGMDPAEMMQGHISHVTAWNSVLTLTQTQTLYGARNGFAGELSGTRAARIAGWVGVTGTAIDVGASLMAGHPAAEQTPLAAFKQVATSEAGLFFISGDDKAVFHGRVRRQLAAAPSITLAADQCGADLQFTMDDQLLINDVSVSRSGRTVTRVTDQASIVQNEGTYAATVDTLLYTDIEAIDRAAYTVTTYGSPQPRAGQLSVDAHSLGTVWDQMLGSEIGQRIAVTGLPSEAVSSSLELWCEGVEDSFTDSTWTFRLDTSPVRELPAFVLDDATYGTLDNNALGW